MRIMEENKTSTWEEYRKRTHVIGRAVSAVTLVMLVGAPFLMGKILGAYPDLGAVARAFLSVGLVWLVSSVAEFLIYTPMLGSGGGYLAFITGNLINMKIPCAVNARDMPSLQITPEPRFQMPAAILHSVKPAAVEPLKGRRLPKPES